MREFRLSGSVRGARGNPRPYRDPRHRLCAAIMRIAADRDGRLGPMEPQPLDQKIEHPLIMSPESKRAFFTPLKVLAPVKRTRSQPAGPNK